MQGALPVAHGTRDPAEPAEHLRALYAFGTRAERPLEPAATFPQVAVRVPERPQRGGDAVEQLGTMILGPRQCGPNVEELQLQSGVPFGVARAAELGAGPFREEREQLGVMLAHLLGVSRFLQALRGVLADGLEHRESVGLHAHEALVGESVEGVEVRTAHRLGLVE